VALFQRKRETPPEPPARRFTDAAQPVGTALGTLSIKGELQGSDSVVLSGSFEGSIVTEGFLGIAEGATVKGRLTARDVVVEGHVQARIVAHGKVELRASARVQGDIEARGVALADGCFFDGRIHMRTAEGAGTQPLAFREKRRSARAEEPTAAEPSADETRSPSQ
jgi:cytoskeletal protein CcmA (bactofilin family)